MRSERLKSKEGENESTSELSLETRLTLEGG